MTAPKLRVGSSYHVALSVDVDRFSDRQLKRYARGITVDGKQVSVPELRAMCRDFRARGYDVFPPCDHTDERGNCLGHEMMDRGSL